VQSAAMGQIPRSTERILVLQGILMLIIEGITSTSVYC